jgi:hypothetical protein
VYNPSPITGPFEKPNDENKQLIEDVKSTDITSGNLFLY